MKSDAPTHHVRRTGGRKSKVQRVPSYRFQRFLCSAGEWRFCQVLEEAIGDRFDIMFQVRVAAILRPLREDHWEKHGRRISQKAFDFVLIEKGTSLVRCAIELDDRTHQRPDRRSRDRFLELACKRAGLPLVRVRVTRTYDASALGHDILRALERIATHADRSARSPSARTAIRHPEE